LEIEPELRGRVEGLREKPRCFGRDSAFSANEFIDPLNRNAQVLRKRYLSLTKGRKEFLAKNLAGMRGNTVLGLHAYPL
jgi:hypothetical protein